MGLSTNQIPLIEAVVSLAKQLETNLKGMSLTPNVEEYSFFEEEIEECLNTMQAIINMVFNKKTKPLKQVQQATAEAKAQQPKAQQPKAKQNKHRRHLWTDDEKREAMRMYAEGVDMDIIVEKFQSTPQSVQKIMQKAGIRRPWPTKGNPSKVAEAEPEAVPVPSAEELEAEDRQRKADLREYRKQHPKPYYLN